MLILKKYLRRMCEIYPSLISFLSAYKLFPYWCNYLFLQVENYIKQIKRNFE